MRILILLMLVMTSLTGFCQNKQVLALVLTPTGFVNADDSSKNFIVLEYPGKKQQDLFKLVELFINKTYASPKDVVSKVEPESITINGFSQNAVRRNGMHVFDMNYSLTIEFKDEKMRVLAPTFRLTTFTNKQQTLHLVSSNALDGSDLGIYSPKLKLNSKLAKADLENFFTSYVRKLNEALSKKEEW